MRFKIKITQQKNRINYREKEEYILEACRDFFESELEDGTDA